jgi:hypothetical protein
MMRKDMSGRVTKKEINNIIYRMKRFRRRRRDSYGKIKKSAPTRRCAFYFPIFFYKFITTAGEGVLEEKKRKEG